MADYTVYRTVGNKTNTFVVSASKAQYAMERIAMRDGLLAEQMDLPLVVHERTATTIIMDIGDTGVVYCL